VFEFVGDLECLMKFETAAFKRRRKPAKKLSFEPVNFFFEGPSGGKKLD
jgi:hypothetical protein